MSPFKVIRYFVFNAVWAGIVYYGTFGGIAGFANIAIFGAWFLFVVSALLVTDVGVQVLAKNNDSVYAILLSLATVLIVLLVISTGWLNTVMALGIGGGVTALSFWAIQLIVSDE